MTDSTLLIFQIIVLIFSVIIHEYLHGWMADRLGDTTPKLSGRLTLNPIPHIDLMGSIIVPLVLLVTGSRIMFGWAKPVPFNPYNLRDRRYGAAKVAAAGPLGNLTIAFIFGMLMRFVALSAPIADLFSLIVIINLSLAVFNLVPIPPLDGSRILAPFLPARWRMGFENLERYGFILVLVFIFFFAQILTPVITFFFSLFTGYYF